MWALFAFFLGVAIAQAIKTLGAFLKPEEYFKRRIINAIRSIARSGGMPSGHTLSLTSVTTYLGLSQGWNSPIFALAVGVTWWFAYDAVHARRSIGEQGKVINKILDDIGEDGLQLIEGHTLPEVIVGFLLGLAAGVATFYLSSV